jgi:serine/threonine-protein kinase
MGVVYRALDEHLQRDVAIKVLTEDRLVDEDARKRFHTEARALSKLNHPNIETAHDFDTEGGVDFLVTEFIPGNTLATELSRGPLPEKRIVRLGAQLADGLAAAHDLGILHRDLKPGNLHLTPDGRLKILDFGLAKLAPPLKLESEAETQTGDLTGTFPYMAPEQLRGETADERTDIYAAGTVLYEMATGQPLHREQLVTALIDSILHREPAAPRTRNAAISPDLDRIIVRCLQKPRENRYQSAKELANDLRRLDASVEVPRPTTSARHRNRRRLGIFSALVAVALTTLLLAPELLRWRDRATDRADRGSVESLAVLPFDNLMGDAQQEYFVDGMHEALIADLAKIGALRVISRTSVMQYRDARQSLPEIAEELGVDVIVEGSVLRAGDRVRITAQLVDASTDTQLWAESYEGDLRNVLQLQSDTARAIARQIRVVVTEEEEARLDSQQPIDLEAYEAYLKGRYYLNQRTEEAIFRSLHYLRQSIERDPSYALAHAALAEASILTGWYNWVPAREAFPPAETAAEAALDLDGNSAEAHTVSAALHMLWRWDSSAAERGYRRAIELNPSYPRAHHWYALFLTYRGRYEEAIPEIQRAQELDPLSIIIHTIAGLSYCYADRHEEALREAEKTLEMHPRFPLALEVLECAFVGQGRYTEAIATAEEAAEATGGAAELADLAQLFAATDQRDRAFELLSELELRAESEYISPMTFTAIELALGRNDQALDWLEKAYEKHSWELFLLDRPTYDVLRSDPRFQALYELVQSEAQR